MLGTHFSLTKYLQILSHILTQLPTQLVEDLAETVYSTWSRGGTVFLCGEGPAARIVRLIEDHLTLNDFRSGRSRPHPLIEVRVIPLDELPFHADGKDTALTKESGLKWLEESVHPGDLLLMFSTSDPTPQLQAIVEWANRTGHTTWALTAHHGGRLRKSIEHLLSVPLKDVGLVESIQLMLMHWVGDDVSARLAQRGRYAPSNALTPTIKADEHAPLPLA